MWEALKLLFGFLGGFTSNFLPELLGYFKQRQENTHELKMRRLEVEAAKELREIDVKASFDMANLAGMFQLALAEVHAAYEQQKALLKHDTSMGDDMTRFTTTLLARKVEGRVANFFWQLFLFVAMPFITVFVTLRFAARANALYAILAYYGMVKYALYQVQVGAGRDQWETLSGLWNSDDYAVMGCVMGFWFGQQFKRSASASPAQLVRRS